MMDERFLEHAERRVEAERDHAVRLASAQVMAGGRTHCEDCGEEIELARREAAPFAVRCLECQQSAERGYR